MDPRMDSVDLIKLFSLTILSNVLSTNISNAKSLLEMLWFEPELLGKK